MWTTKWKHHNQASKKENYYLGSIINVDEKYDAKIQKGIRIPKTDSEIRASILKNLEYYHRNKGKIVEFLYNIGPIWQGLLANLVKDEEETFKSIAFLQKNAENRMKLT